MSLWISEQVESPGGWHAQRGHGSSVSLPPHLILYISSSVAFVIILDKKPVIVVSPVNVAAL